MANDKNLNNILSSLINNQNNIATKIMNGYKSTGQLSAVDFITTNNIKLSDLSVVSSSLTSYTNNILSSYYTKSETSGSGQLNNAFENISGVTTGYINNNILSAYYTKSETSSITQLDSTFENKANLDSPQFTGNPTVPTISAETTENTLQIVNVSAIHNILGDIPVTDNIDNIENDRIWNIPGTNPGNYQISKLRLVELPANTSCTLNIDTNFLKCGNIIRLRVYNPSGGSLTCGTKELITASDIGTWLVSLINLTGDIEILGEKIKIYQIQI